MTKDALRSPRAVLRSHRSCSGHRWRVLCGSVLLSVSTGLSEDPRRLASGGGRSPTTATQAANLPRLIRELRAAMSYRIAISPHAGERTA